MVSAILVGCSDEPQDEGVGDAAAMNASSEGREPVDCPALGASCPEGCDAIVARAVQLDEEARCIAATRVTLGCYLAPEDENDMDACVVDGDGAAWGMTPSQAVHLTEYGYRDCSSEEQEAWTSAVACE